MFDRLFKYRSAVMRHRNGPMLEERLAFLTYLADQDYSHSTLRKDAIRLLAVARMLRLTNGPRKVLTVAEVKRWTTKRSGLYPIAVRWLQFLGRLQQPIAPHTSWPKKIQAFAEYMEHEAGLSPGTIYSRCWWARRFFHRLHVKDGSLRKVTPHRIDMLFQKMLEPGGYSRKTIQYCATALRAFFRFAESRKWCRRGLAASIQSPRVFSQTSLPRGPSWDDVRRLLAMTEGDQPHNIRARPILMLLAVYGLRRGEVMRLRLEDFDWEHEVFRVVSSKTRRVRTYPLTHPVGDAILRYLQEVRPRSSHRELFLSLNAPFRPMQTLTYVVRHRLQALQVPLPHYGAHVLRHACAMRLLAAGLSLKEIGDQLGHTDPETTRIYAKVDLVGLRQVADLDLGGVV